MPNLTYTSTNFPFQPFTKILSSDVDECFTDIQTLFNTTKLDDTNVQTHGLTRVGSTSKLKTGTANVLLQNDSNGDMAELAVGTANYLVKVNSAGTGFTTGWTAPTLTSLTSTGTTIGYVFINAGPSVAPSPGDTYTNNGHTYTLLGTGNSATDLFFSGASAPQASGTLTRAAGSGDATIVYTSNQALATYTKPANALYLRVRMAGGGQGGGGGGATSPTATYFGYDLLKAPFASSTTAGAAIIDASCYGNSVRGVGGDNGLNVVATSPSGLNVPGGRGASTPLGGGGKGAANGSGTAISGLTNTGSGGGGGGSTSDGSNAMASGAGGGAGTYIDAIIPAPASSYVYAVGTKGTGAASSSHTTASGDGADGVILIQEYYQ